MLFVICYLSHVMLFGFVCYFFVKRKILSQIKIKSTNAQRKFDSKYFTFPVGTDLEKPALPP